MARASAPRGVEAAHGRCAQWARAGAERRKDESNRAHEHGLEMIHLAGFIAKAIADSDAKAAIKAKTAAASAKMDKLEKLTRDVNLSREKDQAEFDKNQMQKDLAVNEVAENSFGKVISLIRNLLARLKEQAAAEADHKADKLKKHNREVKLHLKKDQAEIEKNQLQKEEVQISMLLLAVKAYCETLPFLLLQTGLIMAEAAVEGGSADTVAVISAGVSAMMAFKQDVQTAQHARVFVGYIRNRGGIAVFEPLLLACAALVVFLAAFLVLCLAMTVNCSEP